MLIKYECQVCEKIQITPSFQRLGESSKSIFYKCWCENCHNDNLVSVHKEDLRLLKKEKPGRSTDEGR